MPKISAKEQKILSLLLRKGGASSSAIFQELRETGEAPALVTIKRTLSEMTARGFLKVAGAGPSTSYEISALGRVAIAVDAKAYCAIEPDRRYGLNSFNFELFSALPAQIFSASELQKVTDATAVYQERAADSSPTIQKKELERLVIELSWKSSKIEGNTYTLLDTEKLLLENKEAAGHSKEEALMILNHKNAFTYIHEHKKAFKTLTRSNLEDVHALLVKDLSVSLGLRKKGVGVLGSKYKPLDTIYQIGEAVEELAASISRMTSPYERACVALLGISYIQPFEDGNKRTSRLMANALLMAEGCAPLSYRSVDEEEYREAMLVFYELNTIIPFKKIFIEQYDFAARTYSAA